MAKFRVLGLNVNQKKHCKNKPFGIFVASVLLEYRRKLTKFNMHLTNKLERTPSNCTQNSDCWHCSTKYVYLCAVYINKISKWNTLGGNPQRTELLRIRDLLGRALQVSYISYRDAPFELQQTGRTLIFV